ncbi:MAG: carboxylesterase family protein [Chloroflexi bacterium]|nr:carboxylesterase family protein [Chloroflexota bacterium]MYD16424.1 carboxylesterase family protein [Chloroflexota bacterium]MYJ01856.1 carboxylesterase family protein [Chloroflexota bacterium]
MASNTSTVETRRGDLRGQVESGLHVFRGVPYAQPPVGDLRWRRPQPLERWDGVRDALEFGPISIQPPRPAAGPFAGIMGHSQERTSEDCLYLNVWTPGLDDARRPVMLWIHGGGLSSGSGSSPAYDGSHLAARGDAVIVTINYRLGALGFLPDPVLATDGEAEGNFGFHDMVAALEWVRDEIATFGGEPGNVTIFGESAGGIAVGILLASPRAEGLFHRAIIQSGAADRIHSRGSVAEMLPYYYRELGLDHPSADELRRLPAEDILNAQSALAAADPAANSAAGLHGVFNAVIEDEFLDAVPIDAVRAGRSSGVDLLAGTMRNEFTLLSAMAGLTDLNEERALELLSPLVGGSERAGECYETYRTLRTERGEPADPLNVYNAAMTDRQYRGSTRRLLDAREAASGGTYAYLVEQQSPMFEGRLGSPHALDVPLIWGTNNLMRDFVGDDPQVDQLSRFMMDAWLNFARTGNPGTQALPGWPQYRSGQPYTMIFGPDVKTTTADREEELALWR